MDNHHLRGVILKLQDCLSDNDRQRLHFFLGNDVPRQIRDDPTLNGTLRLMESLFDQDKINERDVTFLIKAFHTIQCFDAVKILNEHTKQIQSNRLHRSTQSLSSIIPSFIDQVILDQDDKNSTQTFFLNPSNNCNKSNKIINSNNTNINPLTITIDNKKILSSNSKRNHLVYMSTITNKYIVLIFLLLVIAVGILASIFVIKLKKINQLKNTIKEKDDTIAEEQKKNNQTSQQLKHVETENNRLTELIIRTMKKSTKIVLIKPGEKFGDYNGEYFDDSSSPDFTCHYVSGIAAYGNNESMESYQFFYSSDNDNDNHNSISTQIYGDKKSIVRKKFEIDNDERIHKVEGQIIEESIILPNGTKQTILRITGLQLFSSKGRASPSYEGILGQKFVETFDGYTLRYITGRSNQYIHQLQFFWHRTVEECY